jgi:arylsulfatase A-like enzyme
VAEKSILDVAPTVLGLLDTPRPTDMDGTPMESLFERDVDAGTREPISRDAYSSTSDEDGLSNRLKDLGYLE